MLQSRPQVSPTTVLEYLQDKYLGKYPDNVRRTLQRRIRTWKACHGDEREIMFLQDHQPGMRALSDFTQLKGTVITINGRPLEHKLFHFRLEWSRWSWMRVVTGGESFTALAEGLQEALGQLGGVPAEHRTDSLAAAWKNLSEEDHRDQTARDLSHKPDYSQITSYARDNYGNKTPIIFRLSLTNDCGSTNLESNCQHGEKTTLNIWIDKDDNSQIITEGNSMQGWLPIEVADNNG